MNRLSIALMSLSLPAILVGCGGSNAAGPQAASRPCQSATASTFSALRDLNSRLDVGLNQGDYATQVGNVNVVLNQLPSRQLPSACQPVLAELSQAVDAYKSANDAWST